MYLQQFQPQDLNRAASEMFSNFSEQDLNEFIGYTEDLEFGGEGEIDSFLGEGAGNRQFMILIDNNNNANVLKFFLIAGSMSYQPKQVLIPVTTGTVVAQHYETILAPPPGLMSEGYFLDKLGIGTSAVATDATGGLTARSTGAKSIYEMQEYLKHNPSRLLKIKITSDNPNQIQQQLTIRKINPFAVDTERYLYPANEQNQFVNQDKISVFNTPNLVLGPNTQVEYAIAPSAQATVTLFFGASADQAKGLQNRGNRADGIKKIITPPRMPMRPGLPGRRW